MNAKPTPIANRCNVYARVTESIIRMLEAGPVGLTPRSNPSGGGRPLRFNGTPYRGINTVLLWAAAMDRGFGSNTWVTYRQAAAHGGQVRKGEHGTLVVYAGTLTRGEEGDDDQESGRSIAFLKGYTVFNLDQIDGLPTLAPGAPTGVVAPIPAAETFVSQCGAEIRHGGDRAFYSIREDRIQLPPASSFSDADGYMATKIHELTHWTGHPSRLAREFGHRFGDAAYAFEELIAELCSAFLCADLGVSTEPRSDHAQYLASWITVLQNHQHAIVTAASQAQKAADYLHTLQGRDPPA